MLSPLFKLVVTFAALAVLGRMSEAGPPFLTDDPEPVDYRHWEFYLASSWEFHHAESDATMPHIEINYGAVPDVQLHLIAPMELVKQGSAQLYGYSDTELGVKFRVVQEKGGTPQIGIFPMVELPTGDQSHGLGNGTTRLFLPVWLQKSWGKMTTYGGAGYWYNPGTGNKNWLLAGWEAQYDISPVFTLGGEIFYHTRQTDGGQSGTGFNLGGHHHLLLSAGHSLTGETSTTLYLSYQITT